MLEIASYFTHARAHAPTRIFTMLTSSTNIKCCSYLHAVVAVFKTLLCYSAIVAVINKLSAFPFLSGSLPSCRMRHL